ncbi:furin-like protease kpc-1 isoform X2 [Crassostrea virginica]
MLTSLLVLKMPLSTVHTFVVVIFTFASFAKSGITSKEYAIKADSKSDVIDLCRHTGCTFIRQVTSVYFLVKCPAAKLRSKTETSREMATMKHMAKTYNITKIEFQDKHKNYPRTQDSHWTAMWNVNNDVQPSMKVQEAWSKGRSGSGVVVAVVDDGVQLNHPDLRQNINPANSYDYYNSDQNPTPTSVNDSHGTMVTGLVAAEANNNQCIVGIAYNCTILGVKILGDEGVTDSTEASALNHKLNGVDIYTNSWGPSDGFGHIGPGSVTQSALYDGVTKGRNKKGVIYVWAAGNGGLRDNCNADGYVNSIFTIPITSVGVDGRAAYYAEVCAPVFAATYSGNKNKTLTSTSLASSCVDGLQGTSFSAPQAAGMIALALETNPELTWRDVQHLIVETSKRHDLQDDFYHWQRNGAGFNVSQVLGFGLMDADALVEKAKTWIKVPEQKLCSTSEFGVYSSTNYFSSSVQSRKLIRNDDTCQISSLEHVKVLVSFSYTRRRGNVVLTLESPAGTKSFLLTPRPIDSIKFYGPGSRAWYYSTVHFWGEKIDGLWTLTAKSDEPFSTQVTLESWQLRFYGFNKVSKQITEEQYSQTQVTSPSYDSSPISSVESDRESNDCAHVKSGIVTVLPMCIIILSLVFFH